MTDATTTLWSQPPAATATAPPQLIGDRDVPTSLSAGGSSFAVPASHQNPPFEEPQTTMLVQLDESEARENLDGFEDQDDDNEAPPQTMDVWPDCHSMGPRSLQEEEHVEQVPLTMDPLECGDWVHCPNGSEEPRFADVFQPAEVQTHLNAGIPYRRDTELAGVAADGTVGRVVYFAYVALPQGGYQQMQIPEDAACPCARCIGTLDPRAEPGYFSGGPVEDRKTTPPTTQTGALTAQTPPKAPAPKAFGSPEKVGNVAIACPQQEVHRPDPNATTVMLRGLDNSCTHSMLFQALESLGFADRLNLLYIPSGIKATRLRAKGYAFVDCVDAATKVELEAAVLKRYVVLNQLAKHPNAGIQVGHADCQGLVEFSRKYSGDELVREAEVTRSLAREMVPALVEGGRMRRMEMKDLARLRGAR